MSRRRTTTQRLTTTEQGYGYRWQKIRLIILERDNHTCQRCGRPARSVDHIKPKDCGGTDDPTNLRALCIKCNSSLGAQYVNAKRGRRRQFLKSGPSLTAPSSSVDHSRLDQPTGALTKRSSG